MSKRSSRKPPGKVRTPWHPLFVNILEHHIGQLYRIEPEVQLGTLPLRADAVLRRRRRAPVPELALRRMPALVQRLGRITVIELKSPTDSLELEDLDVALAHVHLLRAQQRKPPKLAEMTLMFVAPSRTVGFDESLSRAKFRAVEEEAGIHRVEGPPLRTFLIEADEASVQGNPGLALVSRRLLTDPAGVVAALSDDPESVLYFIQQVGQIEGRLKELGMEDYTSTRSSALSASRARIEAVSSSRRSAVW